MCFNGHTPKQTPICFELNEEITDLDTYDVCTNIGTNMEKDIPLLDSIEGVTKGISSWVKQTKMTSEIIFYLRW